MHFTSTRVLVRFTQDTSLFGWCHESSLYVMKAVPLPCVVRQWCSHVSHLLIFQCWARESIQPIDQISFINDFFVTHRLVKDIVDVIFPPSFPTFYLSLWCRRMQTFLDIPAPSNVSRKSDSNISISFQLNIILCKEIDLSLF